MTTLTLTAKGQVTFRKELQKHLGVKPGSKIVVDMLPDGRIELKADRPKGSIDAFLGLLADKTTVKATLEEINETIEKGWAGLL